MAQLVKNPHAMWKTWVRSMGGEDSLERDRLPTPVFWPRELHGLYGPWGGKELDMTEQRSLSLLPTVDKASLVAQMVTNPPEVQETPV